MVIIIVSVLLLATAGMFYLNKGKVSIDDLSSLVKRGFKSNAGVDLVTEKSYDSVTKTVTIKDSVTKEDIAEIKLNTPLAVETGYGGVFKVAEFQIDNYKEYSDVIKGISFYNLNEKNEKTNLDFEYQVKGYENITVDDYNQICSPSKDGTPDICTQELSGSHIEQRETWTPITKIDLNDGEKLTIGIFTYVNKGDKFEWVMNAYGENITEWATWEGSLSSDLEGYYAMDESSGLWANSSLGIKNFSLSDEGLHQGVFKYGTNSIGVNASSYTAVNYISQGVTNFGMSVSFWLYWTGAATSDYELLFSDAAGANAGCEFGFGTYGQNTTHILFNDNFFAYNASDKVLRHWDNYILTYSGVGNMQVYKNGVWQYNSSGSATNCGFQNATANFTIFRPAGNGYSDVTGVYIDEVAIYSRGLTQQEITDLQTVGQFAPTTVCNFSGYVLDENDNPLQYANVTIVNHADLDETYSSETDATGYWTVNIVNSTKEFFAYTYYNNTLIGQLKPYISGTC